MILPHCGRSKLASIHLVKTRRNPKISAEGLQKVPLTRGKHSVRLGDTVRPKPEIPLQSARRGERVNVRIPVRVYGRTPENKPFRIDTEAKVVNLYGGLVPIPPKVKAGQTVLLVNCFTQEGRNCSVVYVEPRRRTQKSVGLAFMELTGDFWHLTDAPKLKNIKKN